MLPTELRSEIEATLHTTIRDHRRVSGGCISPAARIETDRGVFFLKWSSDSDSGAMFVPEAHALNALANTRTVRVPAVIARGRRWLALEWLEPGPARSGAWRLFAEQLAAMHAVRNESFGWQNANYIGSLPQSNAWSRDWAVFWREQRLEPQFRRADQQGRLNAHDRSRFQALSEQLQDLLAVGQDEGPVLLHGDLWNGNVHACGDHVAVIDPAAYYGHREVDLAMAALFGGFPDVFWSAYEEAAPLKQDGYKHRRAVYQLYYLLVHVNLFGAGYLTGTREALTQALQ